MARATDAAPVWAFVRPPDGILDLPGAPAATLARIERSINRREKRLFGIVKTKQEFVGRVFDQGFEIWERQQRAVHLIGIVRPRRGGTRVELRYTLAPVTRVVTVLFFSLYLAGSVGLALRAPDESVSGLELAAIVIGAAVLGGGFLYFARRQRAELAAFVARVFGEETSAGGQRGRAGPP